MATTKENISVTETWTKVLEEEGFITSTGSVRFAYGATTPTVSGGSVPANTQINNDSYSTLWVKSLNSTVIITPHTLD